MKTIVTLLLKISRPKFWLYLAGPYMLGYICGTDTQSSLLDVSFITAFLIFLIPANIFLYGINDYYDFETDKLNPRKQNEEYLLHVQDKKLVRRLVIAVGFILLVFTLSQKDFVLQLLAGTFIFLAYSYSAPPFRFKAHPFLDALSNVLYIIPGLFGYYEQTQSFPPVFLTTAVCSWAMAMHLFSSIPDIVADKKAWINTTAVLLGKQNTLLLIIVFWGYFALTVLQIKELFPVSILLLIYPLIPLWTLLSPYIKIASVYRWFPLINSFNGFIVFMFLLLAKPYA